ncbi:YhcH/YjgK/YiaL family protein [Berryella wangjianweii]|uniref:YhcH/YjgK/YiaL family protein n=1 Tax=Berryella wangjianweii TaxID=2734634 RepID=A0A6M8J830_9ACTN|nr:YhcH/YjgK/YiaL family protein [Berryella wangjianweii]QKF07658.1 YhcH/YjgK/YiaL family protein [Berryella wangjianweii]
MIRDTLANHARYAGLPEAFQAAFAFLTSTDLSKLAPGRVEVTDEVFANVARYRPVPQDQKPYEQHFRYADVQVVVEGSELVAVAPCDPAQYQSRDEGHDCVLTDEADATPGVVHLGAGDFAILWPGEAHKPGLFDGAHAGEVLKVVVKVPVADRQ